jgi:CheY-like chemotaxis protein
MMKVLLIEDCHDLAEAIIELLEGLNHEVTWFASREGIDEEVILPFDFILSDFDVDGGHFYETKELARFCSKPLLLMSSIERPGAHEYFLDKCNLGTQLESKIKEAMNEAV